MEWTQEYYRAKIFYEFKAGLNQKDCVQRLQLAFGDDSPCHSNNLKNFAVVTILFSFWQLVLCEVNNAQNYLQTEGLNIHQCAQTIQALQTVLAGKREEFVENALIYATSLCEELEIYFEHPRRIRKKHIFGDGSKDVYLSYEDDLRRTMFSSLTAEIRERFQQLLNLA
ncbi:uncharacterized protein TNCV_806201 [Trichonephila clavipes]|nr:uncharacterized protein TNCV_806201 [Trichonephila clavipes]